jgi:hypothetical protein
VFPAISRPDNVCTMFKNFFFLTPLLIAGDIWAITWIFHLLSAASDWSVAGGLTAFCGLLYAHYLLIRYSLKLVFKQ